MFPDDGVIAIVLANRDPPLASRLYSELTTVIFDRAALAACDDSARPAR